ncbi:3'-5' exoribonuclease YhaM family protein [Anaerovorax odorimutans]|uniref:3'-5' exoribonuclease YhaM family protein n=1 Tax=Anaerovorax odorimutans TaxID=109327 RepID=UPI0003FC722A|nr:HD domain-containing protein [Anaerovorax odorimutans]
MKTSYIKQFRTDDEVIDFFMVKAISIKTGSNKKQFLDLMLADSSGDITAKKWDVMDTELPNLNDIKEGDLVKIKANVTEWNGMKQLRVTKIRKASPSDEVDFTDFIKAAPEKAEDMFNYIMGKAQSIKDEDLKKLTLAILDNNKEKLMYYPAATKNHHAEFAGLLYHVKRMLMMAERVCQVYTNLNVDLVMTGVIIHDIEKLTEIEANEMGISSGYSFEGQMLGHLVQGVKVIDRLAGELGINKEKTIMLEHMLISHHYEPEFGSPKKPLFPEAEILHYLDIIDARMYDMFEVLEATEEGEFSDKVWTLDNRKIYKAKF